jgi:hypothetical protein
MRDGSSRRRQRCAVLVPSSKLQVAHTRAPTRRHHRAVRRRVRVLLAHHQRLHTRRPAPQPATGASLIPLGAARRRGPDRAQGGAPSWPSSRKLQALGRLVPRRSRRPGGGPPADDASVGGGLPATPDGAGAANGTSSRCCCGPTSSTGRWSGSRRRCRTSNRPRSGPRTGSSAPAAAASTGTPRCWCRKPS